MSHRESFRDTTPATLDFKGLTLSPPQTMGAVRLVPVVRDRFLVGGEGATRDLRITARSYEDSVAIVSVDGQGPAESGLKYVAFVPHGLVVSYTPDGSPVAALGASFGAPTEEKKKGRFVRLMHRMVKREKGEGSTSRFRMLPLHLAMEGFLALHFNGPDVLWQEYSQQAIRHGLDPRSEHAVRGTWLNGFEEALRTFEILPAQVGVLVFVADALACALVVPHPEDYRRLHTSLLEDFFGDLIREYAILYPHAPPAHAPLDGATVTTLADLSRQVARVRADWSAYAELLSAGLLGRAVTIERIRTMSPFRLERFMPVFDPNEECHIGERIVREDGTLEYLKTFRLSAAQVRRAYLLEKLAEAEWNLARAAEGLRCTPADLAVRLRNAGFGFLLNRLILDALPRKG